MPGTLSVPSAFVDLPPVTNPAVPAQAEARLAGMVAVITGASTGIGAGVARLFLAHGASVALMSRRIDRLTQTAQELGAPDRVLAIAGDVGIRADAERLIAATVERFGGIDIVVSNAGIHRTRAFLSIPLEEWRQIMTTNVEGTFNVCQVAAREMVARGRGGAIVVIASTNSFVAEPDMAAYNASKAALPLLVQSMAIELAAHGIRVNALAPGTIESEMTRPMVEGGYGFGAIPLGRLGTAEEVAWPALFLASREAAYITGATLVVDGGQLALNGDLPDATASRSIDAAE